MDFNTQNQMPNQGMPMNDGGKKKHTTALIIVALLLLALVAAAYVYMQKFGKDYFFPGYMMNEKTGGKMMSEYKIAATDAGPAMNLNQDKTADIQNDLDQTNVEDTDKQFMDVDKNLQGL